MAAVMRPASVQPHGHAPDSTGLLVDVSIAANVGIELDFTIIGDISFGIGAFQDVLGRAG